MNRTLEQLYRVYDMQKSVRAFHVATDSCINDSPTLDATTPWKLRRDLLLEEIFEYGKAAQAEDIVEVADALTDILYITLGTAVTHGVNLGEIMDLNYLFGPVTPESPPSTDTDWETELSRFILEWIIYVERVRRKDLDGLALTLGNLAGQTFQAALWHHIDLVPLFEEVHRSNMAKVQPDGKVRRRADGKILKPDGWTPPNIQAVLDLQIKRITDRKAS